MDLKQQKQTKNLSPEERKRFIRLTLQKTGLKGKLVRGVYQNQNIDDSSFQKIRYFVFTDVDKEKKIAIRENNLTKVAPKFNDRNILYIVHDCDIPVLIADEKFAYYSISERKVKKVDMLTKEEIILL